LPIRVELKALTRDDFRRILTEPENALIRQAYELKAAALRARWPDMPEREVLARTRSVVGGALAGHFPPAVAIGMCNRGKSSTRLSRIR
jgi:hypothetical protein